jgi:hypothetical protein
LVENVHTARVEVEVPCHRHRLMDAGASVNDVDARGAGTGVQRSGSAQRNDAEGLPNGSAADTRAACPSTSRP